MKLLSKLNLHFARFVFAASLLMYAGAYIPPASFWPAGFLALLIPVSLAGNIALLFFYFLKKSKKWIYPMLSLIIGFKFLTATFSVSVHSDPPAGSFKVMDYNVRVFNVYGHLNTNFESSKAMIKWAVKNDAEIQCFQEYYNEKNDKVFNTSKQLSRKGQYASYIKASVSNVIGAEFGLAIFSKFPIVKRGEVAFAKKTFNNAIFADVKIGKDTVRVYNVHLESMHIDETAVASTSRLTSEYRNLIVRLKNGFVSRSAQISTLYDHIKASPHRVIVCGDLNDLPYSYTYRKLSGILDNTFEDEGKGFGFTYNGKLFFLRIDQQFHSEGLEVHRFETHRKVGFSDHFPSEGVYSVN